MCISPTQNELEQKNNSNNDDSDDDNSTAIARLITRAATTSITASFFQTMGSLGWEQCRSNVGPLMERDPDDGPRLLETFLVGVSNSKDLCARRMITFLRRC